MKVKIVKIPKQGPLELPLAENVLKELGWEVGDEVSFDIPMTGDGTILIYKNAKTIKG